MYKPPINFDCFDYEDYKDTSLDLSQLFQHSTYSSLREQGKKCYLVFVTVLHVGSTGWIRRFPSRNPEHKKSKNLQAFLGINKKT